jgi:hypothetical protein
LLLKSGGPYISHEIYQRKFREAMQSVLDAAPAPFDEHYFNAPLQPTH